MRAGLLSERIEIQAPTESRSATGQVLLDYASVGTYWARVEPLSGNELVRAQATQIAATHRISMRYTPVVTERCLIIYRGRCLDITNVSDGEPGELKIQAREAK